MSLLALPDQTVKETEKTKEWHMLHAQNYATFSVSGHYNDQKEEMLKLYRGYNAELSEEEQKLIKAITCPHGRYLGIEYIVYPLIQTKIEQIVGEYLTRPLRRKAYVIDKKSKNEKLEKKLSLMSEEFMREITKKAEASLGFQPETKNADVEIPENLDEYDFKTIAEEVADGLIKLFLDVRKEKQKFPQMFTHYCITDRAHAVLDKRHGYTTIRSVHPLDADHDLDPQKVVQDNHEYFFENYYLTENEVYNTFRDLSDAEKKEVKKMFESFNSNVDSQSYQPMSLETSQKYNGWFQTSNKVHRIRLVYAMWKSRKRIKIKVNEDKHQKTHYKKLKDDYEERDNDVIENIDAEVPRFVVMLGPDLCLDWGMMEKRYSYIDDPYSCSLPVVSIVRDNTIGTSLIKSVAAKLYQLQNMASEVLFEIRLALKSAGDSRVLVYDAAQTPKEFSKGGYESGLNRVMHHIKKDKLMIINSKQKGASGTFNQFTSLDLSQKGAVQDLFNGLAIIEDLASKFVGISPEREGQVGQYQTATGTEAAKRGSFARTEIIYTPFDEFIQSLLEKVILKGKQDYEKGEVIHYIFGEFKTKFLKVFDEFFASDIGMYISDSRKDKDAAERIDRAAEMALSNANTPELIMGLIEVFEGESASEKKSVFQRMLNSMDKLRQEQSKAQQEAQQAELQAEAQKLKEEHGLKREGYDKDRDVAEIYVQGKGFVDSLKNLSAEKIAAAKIASDKELKDKKE